MTESDYRYHHRRPEFYTHQFKPLYDAQALIAARLTNRIIIDDMGLLPSHPVPFGGTEGLQPTLQFFRNAAEGMLYVLRTEKLDPSVKINKLLKQTKISTDDIAPPQQLVDELLGSLGIPMAHADIPTQEIGTQKPALVDDAKTILMDSTLSTEEKSIALAGFTRQQVGAYFQLMITLGTFMQAREVTFYGMDKDHFFDDYGHLLFRRTYWPQEMSIEDTWKILWKSDEAVRRVVLSPKPLIDDENVFRAAQISRSGQIMHLQANAIQ